MEESHLSQLRCDFRRVYGCSFDEVPVDECLDLVHGLPDGSLYVSSVAPSRAWTETRQLACDVMDMMSDIWQARCGVDEHRRKRLPRPWDADAAKAKAGYMQRQMDEAEKAREVIENTKWEAV